MREFLEFVVRQLVEFPDEAIITEIPSGRTTVFVYNYRRKSDVGRIIGRNGQTIQSILALLTSAAARHNQRAAIEIVGVAVASSPCGDRPAAATSRVQR